MSDALGSAADLQKTYSDPDVRRSWVGVVDGHEAQLDILEAMEVWTLRICRIV